MEESQKDKVCNFKELRFKGRLFLGNDLIRTISMQKPPRVGDEILYHDCHDLPFERWLVKRIAWQVTKETDWAWFHAAVKKVDDEVWPPLQYP
jgi:hypothetical protein